MRLVVTGEDRRGLYADIMEAVSQTGTNIRGADLHTKDGSVFGTIFVEVDNLPHLGKVHEVGAEGERRERDRTSGLARELNGGRGEVPMYLNRRYHARQQRAQGGFQ